MKLTLAIIFLSLLAKASETIDARYDNFDGYGLVLKLIQDNQWAKAESVFLEEKKSIEHQSPSDSLLIEGLLFEQKNQFNQAKEKFKLSIEKKYSHQALDHLIHVYAKLSEWENGLALLNRYIKDRLDKVTGSELQFLVQSSKQLNMSSPVLAWLEATLAQKFDFPLFKTFISLCLENKIIFQARQAAENALINQNIKNAEEVLALYEEFLAQGHEIELQAFLEHARLLFPSSELIKLNLAQILFRKDNLLNALNLLSELKKDDGLLGVQLELMNLMHVKAYSLYHRTQLKDESAHLKNWYIYFINNEDWALLYSLYPKVSVDQKWMTDEFNYAMAYSALNIEDKNQTLQFIDRVKSPLFTDKKNKLLNSLVQ